jgi:toxin FitB
MAGRDAAALQELNYAGAGPVGDWGVSLGCGLGVPFVAAEPHGIERLPEGRRKERFLAAADDVFTSFSEFVIPFDAEAAACYALIVAHRDRVSLPIDGFDAQIAAICRINGAVLATRNVKDFRETGINVVDPWQDSS